MNSRSLTLASVLMLAGLSGAAAQTPSPAPSADPGVTSSRPTSPAAGAPDPTSASKAPATFRSPMRPIKVDELKDMDVVGADGKKIAEIERVVESSADKKQFVVIERGGFLGFGATETAIPIENVAVQGDKATLRNVDAAGLDSMPEYKNENNAFRELDNDQQVSVAQP
jgi:sporulation protein YlmC with PRC-barrel domain